jgi:endonuclease/exonuclease/phosphatase family metal-dependent hydrolase
MTLKLASLNIERSKHLDLLARFVESEKPDILCVQEVLQKDIEVIRGMGLFSSESFVPLCRLTKEHPGEMYGIAIFTRLRAKSFSHAYYVGDREHLPDVDPFIPSSAENRAVLVCDIERAGTPYRIATTHFTWTPDGRPTEQQRRELSSLFSLLEKLGDFVLAGDFNAPRGGETFAALAERYKDNIPQRYTWSLDLKLHRAGANLEQHAKDAGLPGLMVDGLFSTSAYRVKNVELKGGVSDHMAICADVVKTS